MKILYVAWKSGTGGLATTLRSRILALRAAGIQADLLFVQKGDGEYLFEKIPHRYVKSKEHFQSIVKNGKYDYISFIFTTEYIPHVPSSYKGKILFEVRGWSKYVKEQMRRIGQDGKVDAVLCIAKYLVPLCKKKMNKPIPVYVDSNTVHPMFRFVPPAERTSELVPKPQAGVKAIGFVGRIEKNKNWREFVKICTRVAETENIEMWFMFHPSSSPDYNELVKVCSLGPMKRKTRMVGFVPNTLMPEIYSAIKSSGGCLLTTSVREGLGNSVLEPMACGLPVVSSDIPGKNEVITRGRENGSLYPLGDIRQGADAVKKMLNDTEWRRKVIKNGIKTINKHFRDSGYVSRYLAILAKIKKAQ
ncbi:glycosyltransferase family 4 protein [Cohnella thailandensis]|uniref:Glycosyltransferase family 4 protein n=1 Tax=Cohnella thailandensis TaxID=557557 RepID=A0A841SZ07_9BACL|nr:glycosyltransferase family 4 protein [Cohnella thailandensis]MBB6635866.1 glycosyltransferase family 4 protein [Cohnella thailandensis]MBP1976244.1 glycosyltransferase involved in cell wall biosynthesis [Cohnella thailandensis]